MSTQTLAPVSGKKTEDAHFSAYVADEASRDVIDQVARELVIPRAAVRKGTIRTAIEALGQQRSPKILIVDLSGSELPLSDVNELAEVCEPGVTVIAIGDRNDVGLFRELLNSGISDYLVKPLSAPLVQRSLLSTVDGEARGRQTNRLGRLVAVVGTRGGVGTTLLATSLAWTIANDRRRRVALVDLDLQFGSVALALDLEPTHGLREALENASRVDSLYIDRTMARYSDTLFVLSAEEEIGDGFDLDPAALELLVTELRNKYHYLIADLPEPGSPMARAVVRSATHLVLVTDLSLAGMRDTLRISQAALQDNASCQLTVVANRVGEHRAGEIAVAEFERAIARPIDVMIPFDAKTVAAAMNVGRPVSRDRGRVTAAIERVADRLTGAAGRRDGGLLGRLLQRKG